MNLLEEIMFAHIDYLIKYKRQLAVTLHTKFYR